MPEEEPKGGIVEQFRRIASQSKFDGWPVVGDYTLGQKIEFFGQILTYQLRTGNGVENYTSIIRHFGWAVVFGVTRQNQVITLVQWKPGVNRASWELPPGGIGRIDPGADPQEILNVTQQIFLKETGFGGGQWTSLGKVMIETGKYRGAGPNDHGLPAHLFLATDLDEQGQARQPNRNEIMETLMVPLDEFYGVIDSGLFNEASALPCALLALRKLKV
jgi:hypothetical protein